SHCDTAASRRLNGVIDASSAYFLTRKRNLVIGTIGRAHIRRGPGSAGCYQLHRTALCFDSTHQACSSDIRAADLESRGASSIISEDSACVVDEYRLSSATKRYAKFGPFPNKGAFCCCLESRSNDAF